MENDKLLKIISEIDAIKEYLDHSMCAKCLEMSKKLEQYESMLWQYSGSGLADNK